MHFYALITLITAYSFSPRAIYTDRATTACRRSQCQVWRIEGGGGCCMVSAAYSYGRNLGFLDRSRSSVVLTKLSGSHSRPTLLRKSGSDGNQTQTSGSVARNPDHYTTEAVTFLCSKQNKHEINSVASVHKRTMCIREQNIIFLSFHFCADNFFTSLKEVYGKFFMYFIFIICNSIKVMKCTAYVVTSMYKNVM
jgi:hypothetical protein